MPDHDLVAFAIPGVTVRFAQASARATGGSASDTVRNIEDLAGGAFAVADKVTGNSAAKDAPSGGLALTSLDLMATRARSPSVVC